jgi:3,4-dehydroadipyl-CoA semialdehyde dehydrogenase
MTELLQNYVGGRFVAGKGDGTTLTDPVTGEALVRVSSDGLDLRDAFTFARETGGAALRSISYGKRAGILSSVSKLLQSKRDAYFDIAMKNSGTTKNDSAIDIDGAIFTLGQFGRLGAGLGDGRFLIDGQRSRLGKDETFQADHIMSPAQGVALFINAFNFPAWGLWEKAGPALLSGVPIIVKPATTTAWLTQAMVKDVVESGLLPPGAISVVCGSSKGLLDALHPFDMVSFTGSADTAAIIRSHKSVAKHSVRINVEADSLNSAVLLPDAEPGSEGFDLLVKEVVREMTQKSGQKCTAIRRVFVPEGAYDAVVAAIAEKLAKTTVGNPRNETVRMGSLVNREQLKAVREGIAALSTQAGIIFDGSKQTLVDADPDVSACIAPTLLATRKGEAASHVHGTEVFGPVATVVSYSDLNQAAQLVARGEGSLVASIYSGGEEKLAAQTVRRLAHMHGRIHVISPDVAASHTGHGNVMPVSIHGGPGRAGGGEELGGLRALGFYHRRTAVQANAATLDQLGGAGTAWSV